MNWHDVLVREGRYGSPLPHVIGADGAGVARETGEEVVIVPSLWWGDQQAAPADGWEILGDRVPGTYAEMVQVPADSVAPKPDGWSWPQAAAFPLVGLTTYRALFTRGRLVGGESVLVLGAGGGVATMAVTLASAAGAHVVVTSSSMEKIDVARSLGANDGVLYGDPDWVSDARAMSKHGNGFDLVIDSVGSWRDAIASLRPGGRAVVLGASRGERAELEVRPFYFGRYDLLGTTMGSSHDFASLLRFMKSESVPPPLIDAVYSLDDASAAHEHLERGQAVGKVVLHISGVA